MKVLTFLGLSAIGAAYYAHHRRGGKLTLASMRDSATALGLWVKNNAVAAKERVTARGDGSSVSEEIFPSPPGFAGGDGLMPRR